MGPECPWSFANITHLQTAEALSWSLNGRNGSPKQPSECICIHQRQDANAMSTGGIRALTRLILGMSCGHRWHRQLFPSLPALATDSYAKSYASSTNSSDAAPLPFSRFSFYSSRSSGWNNIAVAEKKGATVRTSRLST